MKVHIEILNDLGEVLAEHTADASQPGGWRAVSGQRLTAEMPKNSDNENNGSYELFGFTYQPHLRVDRPNGWTSPVPNSPNNGQTPTGFPSALTGFKVPQSRGSFTPAKASYPRGNPPATSEQLRG